MKILNITIIIISLGIFFSCSKKEEHKELAQKETACVEASQCASMADHSNGCAGCPSAQQAHQHNLVFNHKKIQPDKVQITFVGLGEVVCPMSPKMQPVLQAVQEKYGDQVQVLFYDLQNPEQTQYAQKYNVRQIPTQVFLDKEGNELYRNEGFLTEAEIDQFLQKKGIEPVVKS